MIMNASVTILIFKEPKVKYWKAGKFKHESVSIVTKDLIDSYLFHFQLHILQDEDKTDGNVPGGKSNLERSPKVENLLKFATDSDEKDATKCRPWCLQGMW